MTEEKLDQAQAVTEELLDVAEIKPEDVADIEITDEAEDEFFKSKGKTLKIPKKAEKEPAKEVKETKADKPEEKKEEVKPEQKESKVDLKALQEERAWRKQWQQKAKEYETKIAEYEKQKAPAVKQPNYEEDPLEYLKTEVQQTKLLLTQEHQNRQQQAQEQQFFDVYRNAAMEYTKTVPDFSDAYQFLISNRAKELGRFGYNPEQIQHIIKAEEFGLVNNAFQAEINPAAAIYEWATERGYKKAAPQQPAQQNASAKIETIQKGQELNKSMKGGKIAGQDLTEELIDGIDDIDPFDNLRGTTALDTFFLNAKKSRRV